MTDLALQSQLAVHTHRVTMHAASGRVSHDAWGIAVEVPVQLSVNDTPFAVVMATPTDLHDLAVGMLLTEGLVTNRSQILALDGAEYLGDVTLRATLDIADGAVTPRRLVSPTGCGLCGIESLAALEARTRATRTRVVRQVAPEAVRRAVADLPAHQPINALCHSVHAAAWCDPNGEILLVREDVGRHNALDKLVGALAQADRLADDGFVLMSSRCSYELVHKAAFTAARALVTVSAPTTMALTWARTLGMPLLSVMQRGGTITVVAHDPAEADDANAR